MSVQINARGVYDRISRYASLERRIPAVFVSTVLILSILPMIIFSIFSYNIAKSNQLEVIHNRNMVIAGNTAAHMDNYINDYLSISRTISEFPWIAAMDADEITAGLGYYQDLLPDVLFITVVNQAGDQIARSDSQPLMNIADRPVFQTALLSKKLALSDTQISSINQRPVILIAAPILRNNEEVLGVVITTLDLDKMHTQLSDIQICSQGRIYLIDHQGTIVLHRDKNLIGERINLQTTDPAKMVLLQRANGSVAYHHPEEDKSYLSGYAVIATTNWSVIAEQPLEAATASINKLVKNQILLTLLFTALTLSIVWLISRYILPPIKSAREESKLLAEALEQDQYKSEFYANITHELRTPLNVILGTLQLLDLYAKNTAAALNNFEFQRPLRIMRQNCLRVLRLVNNLIDITKIDSGFNKLHLENCDVVYLIEEITLSVADYIEHKGIDLIFDTNVEELIAACDPDKMERILLNLLSNAAKFTPSGGTIFVKLECLEGKVVVSVMDTGSGISELDLSHIFDRFKQADTMTVKDHEGSGIGLSLVKSFVDMHDGQIWAYSMEGEGSEFSFFIPLKKVPDQDHQPDNLVKRLEDRIERIQVEFADVYRAE